MDGFLEVVFNGWGWGDKGGLGEKVLSFEF